MKNVVLLEDNLRVAGEFADQLRGWTEHGEEVVEVNRILFYDDNLSPEKIAKMETVEHLLQKGLEVEWVNVINFDTVMDRLYEDNDNLFVFDTYLLSDESFVFKYRVNVSYALRKMADKRIWFYTNAGADIKDCIDHMFPGMVMETELNEEGHILRFTDNQEFTRKARE